MGHKKSFLIKNKISIFRETLYDNIILQIITRIKVVVTGYKNYLYPLDNHLLEPIQFDMSVLDKAEAMAEELTAKDSKEYANTDKEELQSNASFIHTEPCLWVHSQPPPQSCPKAFPCRR